jgi:hypothetical protein
MVQMTEEVKNERKKREEDQDKVVQKKSSFAKGVRNYN